jgi:hypothetical protein
VARLINPAVPGEFGATVSAFELEWCGAVGALDYSHAQTCGALDCVKRLWPEEVERRCADSRGCANAAAIVELGLMLDACESADGFGNVLRRLRGGQRRAAYSELVLGALLSRFGYSFSLEPPLDGHVLDAVATVIGCPVYFEVVAPEESQASIAETQMVRQLLDAVQHGISQCRVEIELYDLIDEAAIAAVVSAVRDAAPSSWLAVGSVARVRRIDSEQALTPAFDDADGMQVVIGGDSVVQGQSTSVVIQRESSDARARRIFNTEYHQFSGAVPNVLVVNVSGVADGMSKWPEEMKRLLQPGRNRKVGAILFFAQGVMGPPEAMRRRFVVVENPYAHHRVPTELLERFRSLDEFEAFERRVPPAPQKATAK